MFDVSDLNQFDSLPIHLYDALRVPLHLPIAAHEFIVSFDICPHFLQHYGIPAAFGRVALVPSPAKTYA